jgi:hypothetical protein
MNAAALVGPSKSSSSLVYENAIDKEIYFVLEL